MMCFPVNFYGNMQLFPKMSDVILTKGKYVVTKVLLNFLNTATLKLL